MTDDECSGSDSDDGDTPANEGYRFFDVSILKNVIEMLVCPVCKVGAIALNEEMSSKMGFSSSFRVEYSKKNCAFEHSFFTSKRIGHAFEVNRRAVLAGRK